MNIWPSLRGKHRLVFLGDSPEEPRAQYPLSGSPDESPEKEILKPTRTSPPRPTPSMPSKQPGSSKVAKPSIAAATIVGIIFVAGIVFLFVWYIRRERRARRLRALQSQNQSQDPFCQSTLTLNGDSDRALNEFLMKDLHPERTSLMFGRSRSPSFTFLANSSEQPSTSSNSLSKLDSNNTLTRLSTAQTGPSFMISDVTEVNTPTSPSETPKASATPRLSMASTAPPTARSSQLWTTTTGETTSTAITELSSLLSNPDPGSSRTSNSIHRSPTEPNSPRTSDLTSRTSNASQASSRLSRSAVRAEPRDISEMHTQRRERTSSHRRSESAVSSPLGEELSTQSSNLPLIPSTPSPLFHLSES